MTCIVFGWHNYSMNPILEQFRHHDTNFESCSRYTQKQGTSEASREAASDVLSILYASLAADSFH